jgi:hypothetical protein
VVFSSLGVWLQETFTLGGIKFLLAHLVTSLTFVILAASLYEAYVDVSPHTPADFPLPSIYIELEDDSVNAYSEGGSPCEGLRRPRGARRCLTTKPRCEDRVEVVFEDRPIDNLENSNPLVFEDRPIDNLENSNPLVFDSSLEGVSMAGAHISLPPRDLIDDNLLARPMSDEGLEEIRRASRGLDAVQATLDRLVN